MFYSVRYTGPFGFIKPWTSVRDLETYSQAFLTPSIIEGMRQKLKVSAILRHRLHHFGLSQQQERTQSAGWKTSKTHGMRVQSIVVRGVMIAPELTLAFPTVDDAERAARQHLCLCRNEDLLLPSSDIEKMSEEQFDRLIGNELRFGELEPDSFLVGYNRFDNAAPMYGRLVIVNERNEEER